MNRVKNTLTAMPDRRLTHGQAFSPSDRRRHARKPCDLPADVDDYESTRSCRVLNIGTGGAFIAARAEKEQIGQELIVTIPFEKQENFLVIKARVAWRNASGIGVMFVKG
ncbi:MAG: PilZ domain-containing protein [Desulfatitalea sp.]|nr:PilZ domain-containing protein [Desulfatitalea sp.]NNK02748.1 PilZ domain-containing protein [Desulfatitalea sp.]